MKLELRIALISGDPKISFDLRGILHNAMAEAEDEELKLKVYNSIPSVEEAIVNYSPHFIVVHIEEDQIEQKLNFLDKLSHVASRIPVVVSAASLSAELMLHCVKRGVRDFIKQPFVAAEVQEMMNRLLGESPLNVQERTLGTPIVFFSYKGGIGTTLLSCNTAVSLARQTGDRVLLWDMVLQNGDVPFFFDYEPKATLVDLVENASSIDEAYLKGTLPVHPSGVTILAGPRRPEEAEAIRNDQILTLLGTFRKFYDYIIIDGGRALTDHVIGAMDQSKYIMLTTDLHLPVLKNTLRCLEVFERLGYDDVKFKILLNRNNAKYEEFDNAKAQEILRYPISFAITNDYFTVSRSLNAGIPVADLDKNCLLAKQFDELASLLVTDFKPKDQRKPSLLGKLQGLIRPKPQKPPKKESPKAPEKKSGDSVGPAKSDGKDSKGSETYAA